MKNLFPLSAEKRLWVFISVALLCGMLPITSLKAANVTITKTNGTTISPVYAAGDRLIIVGTGGVADTLVASDWVVLNALTDAFQLELQTSNETVLPNALENSTALTAIYFPKIINIGDYAFKGCSSLTSIDLPSVTTIGNEAFSSCQVITDLNLPVVTTLGVYVFYNCDALTNVYLPMATSIGKSSFRDCNALTSISFPLLTTLEMDMFQQSVSLVHVDLPMVTEVKDITFVYCGFSNISLPMATSLGNFVFAFSQATYISLPSLISMQDAVFANCTQLMCIELGNTPPTMGNSVFNAILNSSLLLIVPDSTLYTPAVLADYPTGTEAFNKTVPTEVALFVPGAPVDLIPNRVPTLSGGSYQWKRNGYPIAGANDTIYQATGEGLYTLEYTRGGGTIILLSKWITGNMYDMYGIHSLYEGCINNLVLTFPPSPTDRLVEVSSKGSGAAFVYDLNSSRYFEEGLTYTLPAQDSVITIQYAVDPMVENGSRMCFAYQISGGIIQTTDSFDLYARPGVKLLKYYPTTTQFAGLLEVEIANGSPYMQRSIDEGITWQFARDTTTGDVVPFTPLQIANFLDSVHILFRQPNTCTPYDTLSLSNKITGAISRLVVMPPLADAKCSHAPGDYYVASRSDFEFTIIPAGRNRGKTLHVSTSRTLIPDSEGVLIVDNKNGTFTVLIRYIQEAVIIHIDFVMANEGVERNAVWTNNGRLYIDNEQAADAWIYSISGSLIQHTLLKTGETASISLPKGLYFILLHGKTYKVMIH